MRSDEEFVGICEAFLIDSESKKKYSKRRPLNFRKYSPNYFTTVAIIPLLSNQEFMAEKDSLFTDNQLRIGFFITEYPKNRIKTDMISRKLSNVQELTDPEIIHDQNNESNNLKIICGQKEFFVSKDILSVNSSVFQRMFSNDINEKKRSLLRISDRDITEEVMDIFLRFLYFGNCDELEEFKEQLIYVSDKYEVLYLKKICEKLIFVEISAKNAIKLLKIFVEYESKTFQKKTIDFIIDNLKTITEISADQLLELKKNRKQYCGQEFDQMFEIMESFEKTIKVSKSDRIFVESFSYSYHKFNE